MEVSKAREHLNIPETAKPYEVTVAIRTYQKRNNLKETGMLNKETVELIKAQKQQAIRTEKKKQQKIRHPKFTH